MPLMLPFHGAAHVQQLKQQQEMLIPVQGLGALPAIPQQAQLLELQQRLQQQQIQQQLMEKEHHQRQLQLQQQHQQMQQALLQQQQQQQQLLISTNLEVVILHILILSPILILQVLLLTVASHVPLISVISHARQSPSLCMYRWTDRSIDR